MARNLKGRLTFFFVHVKSCNRYLNNYLHARRVSRLVCTCENHGMEVTLDVNIQLYPVAKGERFSFGVAYTLYEDGSEEDRVFDQSQRHSLADKFDYVMYGHVFRCEEAKDGKL
jgi:DNA-directed RNA polymerases I, II, and III subunit RPABC3